MIRSIIDQKIAEIRGRLDGHQVGASPTGTKTCRAFNLDLTGLGEVELARLLAEQQALVGLTDEDAPPALPEVPVTAAGVPVP